MKLQKPSEAIIARALAGPIPMPDRSWRLLIPAGRLAGEVRTLIETPDRHGLAL